MPISAGDDHLVFLQEEGFFQGGADRHRTDEDVLGGAVELLLAGDDLGEQAVGQVTDGEIGQFFVVGNDAEHLDAVRFDPREPCIAEIRDVGDLVDDDALVSTPRQD